MSCYAHVTIAMVLVPLRTGVLWCCLSLAQLLIISQRPGFQMGKDTSGDHQLLFVRNVENLGKPQPGTKGVLTIPAAPTLLAERDAESITTSNGPDTMNSDDRRC